MTTQPPLQLDAPQDMYTMPDARIMHFISDSQLAMLELGSRDRLFDYALAAGSASLGFVQNILNLAKDIYSGLPISIWTTVGSMLFLGLVFAGGAFWIGSNRKYDPVKNVVKEIKARQAKPFGPQAAKESEEFARRRREYNAGIEERLRRARLLRDHDEEGRDRD